MNLYRWVEGLGLTPARDRQRQGAPGSRIAIPTTQKGFAEQWGQNPAMVTSFADGSKISFEQAIVANATGFKVQARGMSRGVAFDGSPMELRQLYDVDEVRELGGIVDYTVGPPWREDLLPGRASRSEAAALPEPLQDGRRAAVSVLDPVPPRRTSRRRTPSRASRCSATASRRRSAARSSRSAPSPSAISKRARRSTSTACS